MPDKRGFGCSHTALSLCLLCIYCHVCMNICLCVFSLSLLFCVWVLPLLSRCRYICAYMVTIFHFLFQTFSFTAHSLCTSADMLAVNVFCNTVVNTARRQYQFDTSVRTLNPIPRLRVKVMRPTEIEKLRFMVEGAIEKR